MRAYAASELAAIGSFAIAAVPALAVAVRDGRGDPTLASDAKRAAARALATMGRDASDAVAALVEGVADPTPAVRKACIGALGSIGWDRDSASAALQGVLEDERESADIRNEARRVLPLLVR